jgi:pimeloyl-ACP methyl ester carboxylesterase
MDRLASRFLSPKRTKAKPWPPNGRSITVEVPTPAEWPDVQHVQVVCHLMGEGPAVLLVHGWQAQAADLMPLAQAIVDAGFTVWAPDLPAHGHSEGTWLSIPLAAQALHAVGRLAGSFHAAVAHSLGVASLVHALTQGLQAERVVLLAPPTHYGRDKRAQAQREWKRAQAAFNAQ